MQMTIKSPRTLTLNIKARQYFRFTLKIKSRVSVTTATFFFFKHQSLFKVSQTFVTFSWSFSPQIMDALVFKLLFVGLTLCLFFFYCCCFIYCFFFNTHTHMHTLLPLSSPCVYLRLSLFLLRMLADNVCTQHAPNKVCSDRNINTSHWVPLWF